MIFSIHQFYGYDSFEYKIQQTKAHTEQNQQ